MFHYLRVPERFLLQRVMSRLSISCRTFFVSQCRNFSWVNPSVLCFREFPVAKNFIDKRVGGVSRFPAENFLSHSAEIFRRGNLSGFTIFGYQKSL